MKVGYEGMQMVAIRGDDVLFGNMHEIAECLFTSASNVSICFRQKRKCMGYSLYERWKWNFRLIDRKTKETVFESRTKQGICDYLQIERYELDKMMKYGSKDYYVAKEKVDLWQKWQK